MKKIGMVFLVFFTISSGLHAMDPNLSASSYVDLLANNAQFLKNLIQQESIGQYCEKLSEAEQTLRQFFEQDVENKLGAALGPIWCDETVQLARIIARRPTVLEKLHDACTNHAIDEIKKIVEENPYILQHYQSDDSPFRGLTPLHRAIEQHYSDDVINTLLVLGANSNAKARHLGLSPLHLTKNKQVVKLLLRYGADVNQKNENNESPLYYVLMTKQPQLSLAYYFIKHGADANEVCDMEGTTLLHKAVNRENGVDVVEFLLNNGADSRQRNKKGQTAFDHISDSFPRIKCLFEKHGLSIVSQQEMQLYQYRNNMESITDQTECYKIVIDGLSALNLTKLTRLFIMLRKNSEEKDDRNSEHEILVNHRGYFFNNATFDDLEMIIGKNALNEMKDYLKNYFSHIFENMKKIEFSIIDEQDLNVFVYDSDIAFKAFKSMIKRNKCFKRDYKEYDYDLNGTDKNGNCLLHLAIMHRNIRAIEFLIHRNMDLICARNREDKTPMDLACIVGEGVLESFISKMIEQLFHSDPWMIPKKIKNFFGIALDINACTEEEESLLLIATQKNPQWMSLLLKRGARVNKKNNHGRSPLSWMVYQGLKNHTPSERYRYIQLLLFHGALVNEGMLKRAEQTCSVHDLLQKYYNEQNCCVCFENPNNLSDIPCKNYHKETYLCINCYNSVLVEPKHCPLCREDISGWMYSVD